jgi:hypothetical protein
VPGVFRPYTVADIIGSLQDGITAATSTGTTTSGVGNFTEADETLGITDTAAVTAQASPAWDAGQWGSFTWG